MIISKKVGQLVMPPGFRPGFQISTIYVKHLASMLRLYSFMLFHQCREDRFEKKGYVELPPYPIQYLCLACTSQHLNFYYLLQDCEVCQHI